MRSPYRRADLQFIAVIAAFVLALTLLCLTLELGTFAMRKLKFAAIGLSALGVAGCGTLGGNSEIARQALGKLEHCERTYQASTGALGAPGGSLFIRCPAKPFDEP